MNCRRGQVAIYLIMALVVIMLLTLLNVDTFIAVRGKNRLQNAGDAAAIAAARKQGSLIDEIGRLNFDHIVAAVRNASAQCEEIVLAQRRLALLGPVEALRLANQAALKNGMEVRPEFAQILLDHVSDIRLVYAGGGETDPYPESYPGAWTDYATAIASVAGEGLATGADNIEFYYAATGHLLLDRHFYFAISGKDWCWFKWNAPNLLANYNSYRDWSPLPVARENSFENSEIFSLHLSARQTALTDVFTREEIKRLLERHADVRVTDEELEESYLITNAAQTWFFYDTGAWGTWFNGRTLAGDDEGWSFPIVGEIKPEYNVRGCAAVCRCVNEIESIATDAVSDHTWAAGAKPFGTAENVAGEVGPVTSLQGFVTPSAMKDVRLVPLDAVGGERLATADFGWVNHIRRHLGDYMLHGPRNAQGCFYCLQLQTWERQAFRREGARWLKYYADSCTRPTGGGGGGGGTSHGH
ncbi:MAG: pilus assembly protein TadG-related protein [Kiritimatiellia bacterium]